MGICPFCLGGDGGALTAGIPLGALVLAATAVVVMGAVGRLLWRLWHREAS